MIKVIAGSAKGKTLEVPELTTKPLTSRVKAKLFDLIKDFIQDAWVLDLYAGSGAFGIEALSRGAKQATFIEQDQEACKIIKENLKHAGFSQQGRVVEQKIDAQLLKKQSFGDFDVIFCDPPFDKLEEFNMNWMLPIINTQNLFILKYPTGQDITPNLPKELQELHKEIIGENSLYFLRRK